MADLCSLMRCYSPRVCSRFLSENQKTRLLSPGYVFFFYDFLQVCHRWRWSVIVILWFILDSDIYYHDFVADNRLVEGFLMGILLHSVWRWLDCIHIFSGSRGGFMVSSWALSYLLHFVMDPGGWDAVAGAG